MEEVGRNYYDPKSWVGVAGVDTLIRPGRVDARWSDNVSLWVQDEAHHVLAGNKWGKAAKLFKKARGLGVTATPERADGKGLGRHADGLFDTMVVGPSMRELIDGGYLTDYRIFAPPSDFHREAVPVSDTTGDFKHAAMVDAIRKSRVVGDIVAHYLRIAPGKLGVTFVPDVATAHDVAAAFNAAGIPAAALSAETPDAERIETIRRFRRRELLQLVNVDLFGEGFDLPAIEVVSMARPTESFGLYVQQFGRALRLLDGKDVAVIIDHVGNVIRHGLPDASRRMTLDAREKRARDKDDEAIPVRSCPKCTAVYERVYNACPFCGHVPAIIERGGPEFVDGDLIELDADVLARMRGEIARVDMAPAQYAAELVAKRVPPIGQKAHLKRHVQRQEAQEALRAAIAWWAAYQRQEGRSDSESYRRFYYMFGVDVMTAQTLNRGEAIALAERVTLKLAEISK